MELRSVRLPSTQRYAGRRKVVKACFADVPEVCLYFGYLGKTFRFDSACIRRPELRGQVVASISLHASGSVFLQLYAVHSNAYPRTASEQFEGLVLPRLHEWLWNRLNRPETAIRRHEMLIVEWTGSEHREHALRYG